MNSMTLCPHLLATKPLPCRTASSPRHHNTAPRPVLPHLTPADPQTLALTQTQPPHVPLHCSITRQSMPSYCPTAHISMTCKASPPSLPCSLPSHSLPNGPGWQGLMEVTWSRPPTPAGPPQPGPGPCPDSNRSALRPLPPQPRPALTELAVAVAAPAQPLQVPLQHVGEEVAGRDLHRVPTQRLANLRHRHPQQPPRVGLAHAGSGRGAARARRPPWAGRAGGASRTARRRRHLGAAPPRRPRQAAPHQRRAHRAARSTRSAGGRAGARGLPGKRRNHRIAEL